MYLLKVLPYPYAYWLSTLRPWHRPFNVDKIYEIYNSNLLLLSKYQPLLEEVNYAKER
jgi:hypothetical protein